jgi:hypothetical protein
MLGYAGSIEVASSSSITGVLSNSNEDVEPSFAVAAHAYLALVNLTVVRISLEHVSTSQVSTNAHRTAMGSLSPLR